MIEAIIFDMDGVLVDSEPFHVEIEKRQFERNHLNITDEEHMSYSLNKPVEELIEQFRAESIRFFSELDEIPVMPGLVELLEKLKGKNYPLAVASSSFPEIIELILRRTDLRKYFQVVVSSQEAGKSKPEPDVFLLAAQKLGVSPKNCMVIEDSYTGANPQLQKEADAIVKSFEQLGMMFNL